MKLPLQTRDNYWAAILCLTGFFLHILLCDPLLNTWGMHYSGEEGKFYEKIHPGTVFIFISLVVLLAKDGNPIEKFLAIGREYTAFVVLLMLYVLLFFYMAARSGLAGLAFILDTHISAVICAMVLSYAPASLCRKAAKFFIFSAVVNGIIGIAESIGKFRIFTFEPDWPVLHEAYFRASAFMGHPLDNAIFTSVALFVLLAMRFRNGLRLLQVSFCFLLCLRSAGASALFFVRRCLQCWLLWPCGRHYAAKHFPCRNCL